jgi:protein-S-isoprenylcysteine O-methyltransferase Ste14
MRGQAMKLTPRLVFLTMLGTTAYLSLAVLGWYGFRPFFSHPPLVAVTLITLALAFAALFTEANLSAGQQEDRGNRWVLVAFAIIGLALGFLPAYTDRHNFWTFGGNAIRWLGVFLYAAGGALRIYPVYVLGRRFSGLVAIQPEHTLVTAGVYSHIRHPSYLGALVYCLGWSLAFRSGVGVLLTALLLIPLLARIRAEEALLHKYFAAEYDAYRARTSRLLPGVY